jgi:hypothetical protein
MRPDVPIRGTLVGLALTAVIAASGASASAATHHFRILAASASYSVTASKGCVSGHRTFSASTTGKVPDDPQNAFTPGPGELGFISTRSSTTNTSPTQGQFSDDHIDNPCSMPPCHQDYGVSPLNGVSISMTLFDTGNPGQVKVSPGFLPPGVGDVTGGSCGGPIDLRFPFGEPSAFVPTASLFSGKPVTLTVAGSQHFDTDIIGNPVDATVTYSATMKVQAMDSGLRAVPGGPYSTRRAGRVKLDGSGSKPKRLITDYRWKLRPVPGGCPEDIPLRTTHKAGKVVRVAALCPVRATLTVVARNGDRDSASTVVNVVPRGPAGWRTPFSHREKSGDPQTPHQPPSVTSAGGGNYAFSLFGGLNVSDCRAPTDSGEILCPPLRGAASWLGTGYELAQVNDPNGPFDGFSYVASSQLKVKRAALINPSILPGSPFYQHNADAGRDVAGFVKAIRQHEGMGNGTPRSGHSLIMKTVLQSPTGDARRVIEGLFAPNREGARKNVDKALHAIDRRLDTESDDPLPDIWTGDIEFFDSYQQSWITGFGFRIPGPMRG